MARLVRLSTCASWGPLWSGMWLVEAADCTIHHLLEAESAYSMVRRSARGSRARVSRSVDWHAAARLQPLIVLTLVLLLCSGALHMDHVRGD